MTIQAFALPNVPEGSFRFLLCAPVAARALSAWLHVSPVNPRPPTRSISRRVRPSQSRDPGPRKESIRGYLSARSTHGREGSTGGRVAAVLPKSTLNGHAVQLVISHWSFVIR